MLPVHQEPLRAYKPSAAIVGDPQVVVQLNGSGSHDSDGVITAYQWSDNSADFQAIPDYPYFDPPHEGNTAQVTFVYEYVAGMPNPKITLTVTDNAGLTGTKTIEVNVSQLMGQIALAGKKFAVAANNVYYTADGGLSFISITGFAGNAISVACPANSIVWGNDAGQIFHAQVTNPTAYQQVYAAADNTARVTWISVSKQNPSYVVAGTNKGDVMYSTTAGLSWTEMATPGMAVVKAVFNQDIANEICVVGTDTSSAAGLVKITRDWGSSWQTDVEGLPWPSEARAIARSLSKRYVGLQGAPTTPNPSLFTATGSAWSGVGLGGEQSSC